MGNLKELRFMFFIHKQPIMKPTVVVLPVSTIDSPSPLVAALIDKSDYQNVYRSESLMINLGLLSVLHI